MAWKMEPRLPWSVAPGEGLMLQTGSKVRLAQRSDEAEVISLVRVMHAESGLFPLDDERVRQTYMVLGELISMNEPDDRSKPN